jgi:hypothetical protein
MINFYEWMGIRENLNRRDFLKGIGAAALLPMALNKSKGDEADLMVISIKNKHGDKVPLKGKYVKGSINNFTAKDNRIIFTGESLNLRPDDVMGFKNELRDDVETKMEALTAFKGKNFQIEIKPKKNKYITSRGVSNDKLPFMDQVIGSNLESMAERGELRQYHTIAKDANGDTLGHIHYVMRKGDKDFVNFLDTDLLSDYRQHIKIGEVDDIRNFTFEGSVTID